MPDLQPQCVRKAIGKPPEDVMRRCAFTLIEVLVVIAIIALLIAILLPALGQARNSSRQIKCATQVRGVVQGMIVWSGQNKDRYPLPSLVDLQDATVDEGQATTAVNGAKKDITRHLMSLMIYNGLITPDVLISPAEANPQFKKYEKYEFGSPSHAVDPSRALWDPAFTSTPGDENRFGRLAGDPAGCSYAHLPPYGRQARKWTPSAASINASNSTSYALFGDRGPVYVGTSATGWSLVDGICGSGSFTLKTHGGKNAWKGDVGFSDGRVAFETRADPAHLMFTFRGLTSDRTVPDNIFVNELERTGVQKPANPPPVANNASPESGGYYDDSDGGDMTTAYLRPIIKTDWTTKAVPRLFVD